MIDALQLKFETLQNNEILKFGNIWEMKEQEISTMAQKLIKADQVIQEQLLGWQWLPPNDTIFKFEIKAMGSETKSNLDSSILAESNDNEIDDEVTKKKASCRSFSLGEGLH